MQIFVVYSLAYVYVWKFWFGMSLYVDQGSASYQRSQKNQTFVVIEIRQLEFKEVT